VLASGLSRTSSQLIIFRGFQGIAVSLCLPTATSILTESFPNGKRRNAGFAFLGAGQPTGYSIGLFLGGFFVDTIGWRYGWYMSAVVAFVVFAVGFFALPKNSGRDKARQEFSWRRLIDEIDWVGIVLASACLGILSYVLA
jgi:MFS family permease